MSTHKAALAEQWILKGYGTSHAEVARWLGKVQRGVGLRYCPMLGWYQWNQKVWEAVSPDAARGHLRNHLAANIDSARALADATHAGCPKGDCTDSCKRAARFHKSMRAYESARELSALMTEFRTRSEVLVDDAAEFDAHPYLLNVGNGVVDLRDGTLKPHDPDLLMTHIAGAAFVPGATHADWTQALDALSDLPKDALDWFQRYLGSGASGHTLTDSLNVFLHGNGNNGKSTILSAVDTALGTYAGTVPHAAISAGSQHEQRIALGSFRGLRFALLEETTDDMRLATTAIKQLSSGNEVNARVLNKGNISFPASHTLAIATNHTPYVRESDKGTWRRLVLVPFTKDYTKEPTADSEILVRLSEGADGRAEAVLAWLVEGCVAWYASRRSLTPLPEVLQHATNAWREDSDLLGDFFKNQVTITGDSGDAVTKADLYTEFVEWCALTMNKNPYSSQRGFNAAMKNHEFIASGGVTEARGTGGVKQWRGLRSLGHCLVTTR